MEKGIFDPQRQQLALPAKIVAALERISQAFRVLLWEKAKNLGLSPIQIQILIFVAHHRAAYNNVSFLAKEFDLTKPTISDAIRALDQKGLIEKKASPTDSRSYTILLSEKGRQMVGVTEDFADPLASSVEGMGQKEQEKLFQRLSQLIHQLNQSDILTVQRSCFSCKFFGEKGTEPYCHMLRQKHKPADIRVDCNEYETK